MARRDRETQALLQTTIATFRSPSLLGLELLWRWCFGIPALWWIWQSLSALWSLVPLAMWATLQSTVGDPVKTTQLLAPLLALLWPGVKIALFQLVLPLVVGWVVVSTLGRWIIALRLRRLRPELVGRLGAAAFLRLLVLQAARVVLLAAGFYIFFRLAATAAADALSSFPPNLVLFFAEVVVLAVSLFGVWAVLTYVLSVAPAVVFSQPELGLFRVLWRAAKITAAIEVNLVLAVVKLGLIVLAMVFSAIPVPFEAAVDTQQLHVWWTIAAIGYCIANDFFQVARFVEMLRLSANRSY